MAKKGAPRGVFAEDGLTEIERGILETLPGTVVQIIEHLGLPNTHKMRDTLIKRLIKLQVQGYVRSTGRPERWSITFKGENVDA